MTISVEPGAATEARIKVEGDALGITSSQFASAFIEGYVKAADANHENPSLAAMRFVYENFSKK
jgi:hypothetical protein